MAEESDSLDLTPSEVAEAPVNLQEILKRQPYVVVERETRMSDPSKIRSVFHLANPSRAGRNLTLCGLRFDRATHVPLDSWGQRDSIWCRHCMFGTRNSVKNILKKQVAEYREESLSPAPVPQDEQPEDVKRELLAEKQPKSKKNRSTIADSA